MSNQDINTLLQGLYACGSYQRGHEFMRRHADDLSAEFVAALCDQATRLLGTDAPSDATLARVFADLAIVAAILLADDEQKGLSHHCKGVVLATLGKHEAALQRFATAEAYLRRGAS